MKRNNPSEHELLFEQAFWNQFEIDLQLVQGRLIIQSAFIANRRVRHLVDVISPLLQRNVQVCIYLQTPENWNVPASRLPNDASAKLQSTVNDILALQRTGAHVIIRPKVHVKFAILDEAVFYEGSLNILSHNDNFEGMRRFNSVAETRKRIRQERFLNCSLCAKLKADNNLDHVHRQLQAQRKNLQLTQSELGRLTNLKQSQIARVEAGEAIQMSTLVKICEGLGAKIVLIPNSLTPAVVNLLNNFWNHKLLNALDKQNITPVAPHPKEDYQDFTPNQPMRVKELAITDCLESRLESDRDKVSENGAVRRDLKDAASELVHLPIEIEGKSQAPASHAQFPTQAE